MLYRDLIEFDAIESVKQLRGGSGLADARDDVRTYVISERMRETLTELILPQLRFDNPGLEGGHKGILIVANYGTGKTHLMSTIAGVAEHAELAADLTDSATAKAAEAVAGQLKVIRVEIGAVETSLRDILTSELSKGMAALGVEFAFPAAGSISNNKDALADMMAAFEAQHADKGLLLVIDELLDYLRTRKDAQLILDLGFLRELGEFVADSRFRIIAGIQEALFDNPRFANAQNELRRVRDRYSQARISREDVAFVVQQRLLRKTVGQRQQIRDHLVKFGTAFDGMTTQLDQFVDLYPVHPSYLRVFENLTLVEKRRVLSSLSAEMRRMLDSEVPEDDPGLLCFDAYRDELDEDRSNRAIPEVRDVLDKNRILRDRVQNALPTKTYIAPALRIIDALSVHRLTTGDVHAPIGMTIDELRDDLCLVPPGVPELDQLFIRTTIADIVDQIRKAVSGQFISVNESNGQVYIDLRKDIDYEQLIAQRATELDENKLDAAYYSALAQVLELTDAPYVAGYNIWAYELPWRAHHTTRVGYLFMGAPNERSTAQPPRDFYVYFLQPYDPPKYTEEHRADEVFIKLVATPEEFTTPLRRYAGAAQKVKESAGEHRDVFEARRDGYLQEMVTWLRANMANAMTVTYQGEMRPLGQWLAGAAGGRGSVKTQLDAIAASILSQHLETRYPGYPVFADLVTRANIGTTVQAALGQIVGRSTVLGAKALTALQLIDVDGNVVASGPYAQHLLDELAAGDGKAVNRNDLLQERDPGLPTWGPWHLEPLWLAVVATAMCYLGRLEIGMPGGRVNANGLDQLTRRPPDQLEAIEHIAPPASLPVVQLRRIAQILGIAPGVVGESLDETAVTALVSKAEQMYEHTSTVEAKMLGTPQLWGVNIFDSTDDRLGRLAAVKRLVDDVRHRNATGKMRNIKFDDDALAAADAGARELKRGMDVLKAVERLEPVVSYLQEAGRILGETDPLRGDADTLRQRIVNLLIADTINLTTAQQIATAGESLRSQYATEAAHAHQRDRLNAAGDDRKRQLLEGQVWRDLKILQRVSLVPAGVFARLETQLADIRTCKQFDPQAMTRTVVCPTCQYQPRPASGPTARQQVDNIADEALKLHRNWLNTVVDSLCEPEMTEQVGYLDASQRSLVQQLLDANGNLADGVSDELVNAVNQVFQKFDTVAVSADEMWRELFPDDSAATVEQMTDRFTGWLGNLVGSSAEDKVRVVPAKETS